MSSDDIPLAEFERVILKALEEKGVPMLVEALEKVALFGDGSGVIPCPQDYKFYIQPMQAIAQQALDQVKEKG